MKIRPSIHPESGNKKSTDKAFLTIPRLVFIVLISALLLNSLINHLSEEYFPYGVKMGLWKTANNYGFANLRDDVRLRNALKKTPKYISNVMRNTDIPKISIDIKFKHLQKLHAKRAQAQETGFLSTGSDDYVPARISTNEKTIKVKLRLKGDNIDHLDGSKWSFRVHVKGKDHFLGLRRFSIQHPKTRAFQGEILLHETLRQFGVITPNYTFVDVVINGNNIGIMAIEEHFSKELLERNGRKEGVIVKFNESYLWGEKDFANSGPFKEGPFQSYLNTNIEAFRSSKIKKSESLSQQFGIAVGLLRGFMQDKLQASDVFDAELLGSYLAGCEFWGAEHDILWPNIRFYLNPLTMKLEPIAFDAALQLRIPPGSTIAHHPHINKMLQDTKVKEAFEQTLNKLIAQVDDGSLIKRLKEVEAPVIKTLQTEFFLLESFNYAELKKRAQKVPGIKRPDLDLSKIPAYTHAYLIQDNTDHYLELLSTLPTEVEIHSIVWKDKGDNVIPFEPMSPIEYPIVLGRTAIGELPQTLRLNYQPLNADKEYDLLVKSSLRGYTKIKETIAQVYYSPLNKLPLPESDLSSLLSRFPFLEVSGNSKSIEIKQGQWQVEGDLVIPKAYELNINAGITLQFEEEGSLVVYGSVNFTGTPENPVVLEGMGTSDYWQGIAVFNAPSRSKWTNVIVRNTSGLNWPSWKLTGGTTFYKSDVDIEKSTFSGHSGEDALNIIHSDFNMRDVSILKTNSDAFDSDFCTGTIHGGLFQDIGEAGGGDGVDVSGSKVTVNGTRFIRINDKAISVGEGSELTAVNIVVEDSGVGAASKDRSRLEISDSTINKAYTAALMTYTKKPEYGPADLVASNVEILETTNPAKVQQGNSMTLNGETIQPEVLDVENLYKTTMKGSQK